MIKELLLAVRADEACHSHVNHTFSEIGPDTKNPFLTDHHCSFVDPGDPSTLYLAQPVAAGDVLREQPVYAADYGKEEDRYESTGLRP